jgi:hypothetical protein
MNRREDRATQTPNHSMASKVKRKKVPEEAVRSLLSRDLWRTKLTAQLFPNYRWMDLAA